MSATGAAAGRSDRRPATSWQQDLDDYVAQTVAIAPQISEQQRARLRMIFQEAGRP
jgi:hypothetical protein